MPKISIDLDDKIGLAQQVRRVNGRIGQALGSAFGLGVLFFASIASGLVTFVTVLVAALLFAQGWANYTIKTKELADRYRHREADLTDAGMLPFLGVCFAVVILMVLAIIGMLIAAGIDPATGADRGGS
jgi:hypothetical protein